MFDLLINGGTVADGSGGPTRQIDVGIRAGRIAAMGRLAGREAAATLDATGLLVAPGFIDIHSHSDFTLLIDPRAQSQAFQGVTTEVIGNCGHGCAPVTDPSRFTGNIYGWTSQTGITWRSFSGFLVRMERARPAVNVASLAPFGNLRLAAMLETGRPATPDELKEMAFGLEECLEAGAWGLSTGLEYPAERVADEREIVALCKVMARHDGIYAAHTRNRETHAVEAVQEAVRTAQEAGVRLQVSHIIPRRAGPPGSLDRCVAAVERARDLGLDAAFDSHTRLHGITNLSNALPPWAFDGGADTLRQRLSDPRERALFREHKSIISSFVLGGWDRVSLYTSPERPEFRGKSFAEIATLGTKAKPCDPWDAVFDVLLAHAEDPHAPLCICHSYDEEDVLRTMRHPLCTIGSDATALAVDGLLAGDIFMGAFTWAGWFWRRMVVETKTMTQGQAVAKLTSAPADRMGFKDRGRLKEGAVADIIAFDPLSFRERGTLDSPNLLAEGMRYTVVNGVLTLENGALTGRHGGHVLRKA
ncbi:MAG: hypothetical protein EXR44_01860 [Dehalococcoidia bacterium]|nr:hypothetical protein [Dehalococcoidia bacterium]